MFPKINTLFWIDLWFTIYLTWVWIVGFIMCFLFLVFRYCKKYSLNFWKFFNYLPIFLILPYLFWSYFNFILEYSWRISENNIFKLIFHIFPTSLEELFMIISPYWYNFHFIWIVFWLILAWYLFLNSINIKLERIKWIDIFFYSLSLSLVPLWFLLLMWNDFIWKPSNSFLAMKSFVDNVEYNSTYPIWIFLSLSGLFSFFVTFFVHYINKKYWNGLVWFVILLLCLNIVFLYQQYPRHLSFSIWYFQFDIKNLFTMFLVLCIMIYWFRIIKDKK